MKKAMHALGATLMLGGVIVGPVATVAHADSIVRSSSVESSSSSSVVSQASSKSAVVLSKMSHRSGNNFAASSSDTTAVTPSSSTSSSAASSATPIGQTTITATPNQNNAGSQGMIAHFHTANGDVAYCYNWQSQAPDQTKGVDYNQYKFYDGMGQVTGATKADEVAAALEAGYHKNATTGQYEIAPQFQSDAEASFEQAKKEAQGNDVNTANNGPLYTIMPTNETLAEFEEDVTQSVIWYLDGAPDTKTTAADGVPTLMPGYLATHTKLGQDILDYAKSHPLDNKTAYPQNVSVTANGKTVDNNNPLVMNPSTKESNTFTLNNYNGGVDITNLPQGYEVVDAQTGDVVNQVQSGKTYRVKYTGSDNPSTDKANQVVGNIKAQANYQSLKDSNYFSAVMQNDPVTNNPWQNMVNLETALNNFQFPIIWSSSSQSSSSSESSSSSSSSVKSSSSSSSVKSSSSSSSVKSSSSSSSVKSSSSSSSVKSSSSSSSVKSSSSSSSVKSSSSSSSVKSSSSSSNVKNVTSSSSKKAVASSSAKQGVAVAAKSSSAKGQGKGHGHGLPETGNAIETGLAVIGAMLVAVGAFVAGFKRNEKQN